MTARSPVDPATRVAPPRRRSAWRAAGIVYAHLDDRRRRDLMATLVLMVIGAFAELVTVGAVLPFKKVEEAIEIANDSIYGLAASIWTSDVNLAHKAARDIEAGVVWVNCFDHGDMTQPWGGFKQSGMGRDKCLETLLTVTQTKSVWMHLG